MFEKTINYKTLLLVDETEDGLPNFIKMDQQFFCNLAVEDLFGVLQYVVQAIKPVFSGSLDHRVNMHEIRMRKPESQQSSKNLTHSNADLVKLHKLLNS